ncbi:hypothetical protein AB0N07_47200 [Streptomyces sp. NPDC051172]|uniref:hypothetical protein n=1 Tax=Streptomyces sp. NPDC051172 TaxID=3155796 RepID=UPI003427782B
MSGGGYQVDPEALERITRGINAAMDELKTQGFDIEANLGRGFGDLELEGLEVGDAGLHGVFGDFCERWGWGVRSLMQDANGFAQRLNLSAGLYHEQEQYVSKALKGVATAVAGSPYMSSEEAGKRSWSDTLKDNPSTEPDYSAKSFSEGWEETKQAWAQTEEDVETSTVTPDALFDPRTDWQWGGPPEPKSESFQPNTDASGEAER